MKLHASNVIHFFSIRIEIEIGIGMMRGTETVTGTLTANEIDVTGGTVTEREKETEIELPTTHQTVRMMMTKIQILMHIGTARGYVYQGIILSHKCQHYHGPSSTGKRFLLTNLKNLQLVTIMIKFKIL